MSCEIINWFLGHHPMRKTLSPTEIKTFEHIVIRCDEDGHPLKSIAEMAKDANDSRQNLYRSIVAFIEMGIFVKIARSFRVNPSIVEATNAWKRNRTEYNVIPESTKSSTRVQRHLPEYNVIPESTSMMSSTRVRNVLYQMTHIKKKKKKIFFSPLPLKGVCLRFDTSRTIRFRKAL